MIFDVTENEFADRVVEGSRERPVVVDFWAAWCGPCRQLTPALEAAAKAREGRVDLAKVDVDANQRLAAAFDVQGIPSVKAFRDGQLVSGFVGAQPPAAVERFFDALVPSPTDELVRAGDEASLRKALELEPGRADAAVPLAKLLRERGEPDAALELLLPVGEDFGASGLAARIELERDGDAELRAALDALDADDPRHALDRLLEALAASEDGRRDQIRRVIVGALHELGGDDPLAREYRRRLAAALY